MDFPRSPKVSLRLKIFLPFLLLTLAIIGLITTLVNQRFTAEMHRNLEDSLENAGTVFYTYFRNNIERLIDKAGNVSADARLQASLTTMDRPTIAQTVAELYRDRQADLLGLVSPGGTLVTMEGWPIDLFPDPLSEPVITDALNGYLSGDIIALADTLVAIAAAPVLTRQVVQGVLVMGQQMDQSFLDELQLMTGCQLAFLVNGQVPHSTHFPRDRSQAANIFAPLLESTGVIDFLADGEQYLGMRAAITNATNIKQGDLIIYKSLDAALASLGPIRRNIYLIGLGGILLSLIFSYILARSVTHPVEELAAASRAFGEGRLDVAVQVKSNDEVGTLAHAFEEMRTSLLKAREELVRTERLSTVGRMANAIIHDFKQPINSVKGFADLLRLPGIDDHKREKYADMILGGLDRMMEMVNELLDFARGDTKLHLEPVDLNAVVADEIDHLQGHKSDTELELSFVPGEIETITLDRRRIRRVIENLIGNARNALAGRGRISVATAANNGGVTLTVADDGPGIPPEIRQTLFDPFVSGDKSKGTGLGLAITKSIIEELGGRIDFTTKTDAGTTFRVWLPNK
ncbi:MAG: HAMP domain-containing protein [Candidatus Marinimicrobia bacterium]|nr:HAMP domain-containing protein [Candidatus Neomarinimicrobiota bacterium]